MRRAEARRRRRDVFVTLLGAVGVTFVLAVALGGVGLDAPASSSTSAFVAYVALLVSIQQQTSEREVEGAVHAAHGGPPPGRSRSSPCAATAADRPVPVLSP